MSRRKRKRSFSQVALWVLSVMMVLSMVISLIIVALPGPATPAPTAPPTWTPRPLPTASPVPSATPEEPVVGPAEPTATLTLTPSLELAPPLQPTPTATPAAAVTPLPVAAAPLAPASAPPPASAAPTAVAGLTFAIAGDSRHSPEVYGRVLAAVGASGSEFLVHTGDLVDEGTEEQWQAFEQSMAGFSLPFYPVPGNHDGLGGKLDGYLAHSRAPAAHYSFDQGPVHLAMVDTHHGGVSAAELAWLRDDLFRTDRPLKMVFMHHPPFDPDGTDHIMAYGNEPVMDLMAQAKVGYVFAGHIHAYARGERDGVAYYITGGAGAPLYAGDHPQAVHHFLLVTVRGEDVTVEMVKV